MSLFVPFYAAFYVSIIRSAEDVLLNYTSLFNFSIISVSSSLEYPPKLTSARNGMESVMASVISSVIASEAASEEDSSPTFMAEIYFAVSSFAVSLVFGLRNSSPRVVFI